MSVLSKTILCQKTACCENRSANMVFKVLSYGLSTVYLQLSASEAGSPCASLGDTSESGNLPNPSQRHKGMNSGVLPTVL